MTTHLIWVSDLCTLISVVLLPHTLPTYYFQNSTFIITCSSANVKLCDFAPLLSFLSLKFNRHGFIKKKIKKERKNKWLKKIDLDLAWIHFVLCSSSIIHWTFLLWWGVKILQPNLFILFLYIFLFFHAFTFSLRCTSSHINLMSLLYWFWNIYVRFWTVGLALACFLSFYLLFPCTPFLHI